MDKIKELYEKAFDEGGEVKNCGRYVCQSLIEACEKYSDEFLGIAVNYGNRDTGMMNVENIKKLVAEIG